MKDTNKDRDEFYIKKCFELAKSSLGETSPNPYVGAVIVKDSNILGEGFHEKSGKNHAEVNAILNANQDISGATLYCNLEPCCHTHKKTPPCTDLIIKSRVKRLVISNLDPNPFVSGKGVSILREAGIEVTIDILKEVGSLLNEVFFTHIQKKRPFVHLKWAQTLDGKIATTNYKSKWITGELSRDYVHQERRLYDAVLIGAHTANKDNPKLTIRFGSEEICKRRVILCQSGKISPELFLLTDEYRDRTLIIVSPVASIEGYPLGTRVLRCPLNGHHFDMKILLALLYKEGVSSIYVEGGATVISSFLAHKLYDRLSVYIAPKLLGEGIQSVQNLKVNSMQEALEFDKGKWTQFNQDILFESTRNVCLQA